MQAEAQPQQRGGGIYNYFQGATINNMVINGNMTKNGNEHFHTVKNTDKQSFTDEQIARAIEAICGDGKVLDSKRKWAAVYWYLRSACNFPAKITDFCERVRKLPLKNLQYECDYESFRHFCTLSFMNEDARDIDNVKYSKNDQTFFLQCKEVVITLAKELENSRYFDL